MGFRCFPNGKNAQVEPSHPQSRFWSCILPPISRSGFSATRSKAYQSPKSSSSRYGKRSLRREGNYDEPVEPCSPPPSGTQSGSAVELEEVFKKFDTNGDGKLSLSELSGLMRSLGGNPTEKELRLIVAAEDVGGDPYIDLTEFVLLNTEGVDSTRRLEDLKCAFRMFDKDGNGTISPLELRHVLTSLREPCTLSDCEAMIRTFDSNGDGLINFDEFTAMMNASESSLK